MSTNNRNSFLSRKRVNRRYLCCDARLIDAVLNFWKTINTKEQGGKLQGGKKKNFEEEKFRSLRGEANFAEMPRVDTKNPYCLQKGRGCQRNLINMGERFHRSTVRHSCINMKIIYNVELIFETYCFQSGSSTDLYARTEIRRLNYARFFGILRTSWVRPRVSY